MLPYNGERKILLYPRNNHTNSYNHHHTVTLPNSVGLAYFLPIFTQIRAESPFDDWMRYLLHYFDNMACTSNRHHYLTNHTSFCALSNFSIHFYILLQEDHEDFTTNLGQMVVHAHDCTLCL